MKKAISVILCIAICLSLCACKSKEVKAVEAAIEAIGTVTLDSLMAVETAEGLYNALPEEEKAEVENYNTLVVARTTLDDLRVNDVIHQIDALAENDYSADAVTKARADFDALGETLQAKVTNADALEFAEKLVANRITEFTSVPCKKAEIFKDNSLRDWYDGSNGLYNATLFICFWLELESENIIGDDDLDLVPAYVTINESEGYVELYTGYKGEGVICIRYWPDQDRAEMGTIVTDLEMADYMTLMQDGKQFDSYLLISVTQMQQILMAMMQYA